MENTQYFDFIQKEHCLPDRAMAELRTLHRQGVSHEDYLATLYQLAQDCYCQEPDHPRYNAKRNRFPYPNEADLQSAKAFWAAKGEKAAA